MSSSSSSLPASRRLRAPAVSGFSLRGVFGRIGYVSKVSIATSLGLLLLWQLAASLEVVPAMFLPSPLAVAMKFISVSRDGFQDATLLEHLLASVGRVTAALVAAVVLGVTLGFAMNLSETARGAITPLLELYRPIPPLAYLPLVIIWFGIGEFAKILVIFLGILPSIMIATNEGLRSVSPDRVNAARSLGATRAQVIFLVLLPHAMPSILTGTRIGLGAGWATLVAAELVAATKGLGFMIKGAADFLVTDVVILGILVIAAAAIVMEMGLRVVQRVVAPWQGAGMINRHHVSAAPPPPVGVKYHHATEANGWLYVTGQLPADPHAPSAPFPAGIAAQAEQTFKNLKIIVEAAGFALSDTVFVRIYLTHFERDFDGFNAVYHRYFADDEQVPSRTTIGVAKLGRDALVEVDLVLYRQAAT